MLLTTDLSLQHLRLILKSPRLEKTNTDSLANMQIRCGTNIPRSTTQEERGRGIESDREMAD